MKAGLMGILVGISTALSLKNGDNITTTASTLSLLTILSLSLFSEL